MSDNVIPYHSDSRTAERWAKMERQGGKPSAATLRQLEAEVAAAMADIDTVDVDTAPCEYVAPDNDCA